MADLIVIEDKDSKAKHACYSERGLLSFLVFNFWATPKSKYFQNFLASLKDKYGKNMFLGKIRGKINKLTFFSESNFGQFGSPDMLVAIEFKTGEPYVLFIEAKTNESLNESIKKHTNSSIDIQLINKFKLCKAYFESKGEDIKKIVYKNNQERKTLNLKEGVKGMVENSIGTIKKEWEKNCIFVALTRETVPGNPLEEMKTPDGMKVYWANYNDLINFVQKKCKASIYSAIK